ncbi:Fas-associated factor [Nesidiocoris tenuis]|uniref:Fas-associated factor n=1 Tax=Nesidiocoris tenuis TaxID=355587 RepID=A0ABN7BFU0_9HEMI|nr:Fas-associated factor [Nesidiocoris tenuis]
MNLNPQSAESLIPHRSSEVRGSFEFARKFVRLYIPSRISKPPFQIGTLAAAIKSAWERPPAEVRLLVIYIHRQGSIAERFSRIFHSQTVHELLTAHCILWGWDVTLDANKETLLRAVSSNLGFENSARLKSLSKRMYPCMLLLSKPYRSSGVEVVQFLKAFEDPRFTLSLFQDAIRVFTSIIRPLLIAKENGALQEASACASFSADEKIGNCRPPERQKTLADPTQKIKLHPQEAENLRNSMLKKSVRIESEEVEQQRAKKARIAAEREKQKAEKFSQLSRILQERTVSNGKRSDGASFPAEVSFHSQRKNSPKRSFTKHETSLSAKQRPDDEKELTITIKFK